MSRGERKIDNTSPRRERVGLRALGPGVLELVAAEIP